MSRSLQVLLDSLAQPPGLSIVAVAADAAVADQPVPLQTLSAMSALVCNGALDDPNLRPAWPQLERGLMGARPSRLLDTLAACGALPCLLPEFAALSGCFQTGADGEPVDIAAHQGRVLDVAAIRNAPLQVRIAALLCNLGKSDSPPQHLPAHYRHIDRCLPRIATIAKRFGLSAELESFAVLAAMEQERVHRATRMRADAITALLERVDAFAEPARFDDLLTLCACDWAAYPGHATERYPKAPLLREALAACRTVSIDSEVEDDLHERRVLAVAAALRSYREAES